MVSALNRPTTNRLIEGVRGTIAAILATTEDAATKSRLNAIDVVLNELQLREDGVLQAGFYKDILDVADYGLAVLQSQADSDYEKAARQRAELPDHVESILSSSAAGAKVEAAMGCLAALVSAAGTNPEGEAATFVERALQLETAILSRLNADPFVRTPVTDELPAAANFQAYLSERFPGRALKLKDFRNLVGGYQKITVLFDVEDEAGTVDSMVMRAEKAERFVEMPASAITDEYEIVTMARDNGLKVAEPLWLEADETKMGRRFMVSRRIKGENLGSAIQASGTIPEAVVKSFVKTLAKIHTMKLPQNLPACLEPWRRHPGLRANTLAAVDMWRLQPWTMQAGSSPSFTRLSQWLVDHVPDEEATPCLVHVDYGPHNVLVDGSEVSAVLDWEAARIGDPAEDLSYLLQCFGAGADRQATIDWYTEASGNVISEKRLRYFDAFNLQKMIAGPMGSAVMYEKTPNIAIEWCNLSLRWMAFGTAGVAQRIALAEAA